MISKRVGIWFAIEKNRDVEISQGFGSSVVIISITFTFSIVDLVAVCTNYAFDQSPLQLHLQMMRSAAETKCSMVVVALFVAVDFVSELFRGLKFLLVTFAV